MKSDEIKGSTSIESVLRERGIVLKNGVACCPFHEDKNPSFSVYEGGSKWKCFGCQRGGDVVGLLAEFEGLNSREFLKSYQSPGGSLKTASNPCRPMERKLAEARAEQEKREKRSYWPVFELGTAKELRSLSELRGIAVEGLEIAQKRGLLRFCDWQGHRCWVVTDQRGINAQARRLDGGRLEVRTGMVKAQTLPGSEAVWPIGLREADQYPNIALVEGGPDLLAAHGCIWAEAREHDVAAVAILGASQRPSVETWKALSGKKVRIFVHQDEVGLRAGQAWASSLIKAGARVDGFEFSGLKQVDGSPVEDLNDLLKLHPDDFEEHRHCWEVLP